MTSHYPYPPAQSESQSFQGAHYQPSQPWGPNSYAPGYGHLSPQAQPQIQNPPGSGMPMYQAQQPYPQPQPTQPHQYPGPQNLPGIALPTYQAQQPYVQSQPTKLQQNPVPAQTPLVPQQPVASAGQSPRPATPQNLSLVDPKELVDYLEEHRQAPIPQTWYLPPIVSSLYGCFLFRDDSDWHDDVAGQSWSSVRPTLQNKDPHSQTLPLFLIKTGEKGGHIRDKKYFWTLSSPLSNAKCLWNYTLTRNRKTDDIVTETLTMSGGGEIHPKFSATAEYTSLVFKNLGGNTYEWRSSARPSSLNGARWDTVRHALFFNDAIVADHAFWDGFVDTQEIRPKVECDGCRMKPLVGVAWHCKTCRDHDVCDACRQAQRSVTSACAFRMLATCPDEALNVRMQGLDVGLVIATLQIMCDWERHLLREEMANSPVEVAHAETLARQQPLGKLAYRKAKDAKGGSGSLKSNLETFNNGMDLASNLQQISGGGGA